MGSGAVRDTKSDTINLEEMLVSDVGLPRYRAAAGIVNHALSRGFNILTASQVYVNFSYTERLLKTD